MSCETVLSIFTGELRVKFGPYIGEWQQIWDNYSGLICMIPVFILDVKSIKI